MARAGEDFFIVSSSGCNVVPIEMGAEFRRRGVRVVSIISRAHSEASAARDVPCRTLVPHGRDGLWVVGRCFSATHDAHASCRSMAQTMAMGQPAGLAAIRSLDADCGARAVDISGLQKALRDPGAVLETPDEISAAADAWRHRSPCDPTSFIRTVLGDIDPRRSASAMHTNTSLSTPGT